MAGQCGVGLRMSSRRVIWIILDGVGLKALPDAAEYGDEEAATLPHVAAACGGLRLPNLQQLGLGNLVEIAGVPAVAAPRGAFGSLIERSVGKDSIVGHWELAGVVSDQPLATYPQGFPESLVEPFTAIAGVEPLGNVPAGGISILKKYGEEHVKTARPILYTSVDSVFQVAAHEDVIPLERLYEICSQTRQLVDDYQIGRVIARPFCGNIHDGFRRTARRKDFSMPPPCSTLLDLLIADGVEVSAVGKIWDLFAGRGISSSALSVDNDDGMAKTLEALSKLDSGLLMVNLVDFDMAYGHRNDVAGFGRALEKFDDWLPLLCAEMQPADLLVITADHGCDPTVPGTDHTREYVPVLCWSKRMSEGVNLGVRQSFADVGATLAEFFDLETMAEGDSFFSDLV